MLELICASKVQKNINPYFVFILRFFSGPANFC